MYGCHLKFITNNYKESVNHNTLLQGNCYSSERKKKLTKKNFNEIQKTITKKNE